MGLTFYVCQIVRLPIFHLIRPSTHLSNFTQRDHDLMISYCLEDLDSIARNNHNNNNNIVIM